MPKPTFLSQLRLPFSIIPKTEEALLKLLRKAKDRHVLSPEALNMIERILQVSTIKVREIMIPKAQMSIINEKDSVSTAVTRIIESGHSRFPMMNEDNTEVVGLLLAKDLLKILASQRESTLLDVKTLVRKPFFTPESKRLDVLLREFRMTHNHMAFVLDEYGALSGLITIEDVLEQIVGNIEDEYDIEETTSNIKALTDGTFIVKATTPIEEFNEYFHAHLRNDAYDTISGMVLRAFGHLPKRGEHVVIKPFRFKVLQSDERRLYLLEVRVLVKSIESIA